jgi:hypothetical protein
MNDINIQSEWEIKLKEFIRHARYIAIEKKEQLMLSGFLLGIIGLTVKNIIYLVKII